MLSQRRVAPASICARSYDGPEPRPFEDQEALADALRSIRRPLFVLERDGRLGFSTEGAVRIAATDLAGSEPGGESSSAAAAVAGSRQPASSTSGWRLVGYCDPVPIGSLGDPEFRSRHRLRANYVVGAMANGIASTELVVEVAKAGLLAFFGAGGLAFARVRDAVTELRSVLFDASWGANLIHSPAEPELEDAVSRLYVEKQVRLVSASAYLRLTLPIVRYRLTGIGEDAEGRPQPARDVLAKVSRVEVGRQFWSPAPAEMIDALRSEGTLDRRQAELAGQVPVARDLTIEADSGGHTDNRPAVTLLPTFEALSRRLRDEHGFDEPLRYGAAGGISTPSSVLAAFEMGAAYVLTGSINQATLEAGTSDQVRRLLAETEQADVAMAPAADMFELGVKLQVLKRGTLFASRAQRLYDAYRRYDSLESIPAPERTKLEKAVLGETFDEVWRQTTDFWKARDPKQLERAERDAKHRMALTFRWYLGLSSQWANRGVAERQADFQVWCGPSMGAFNEWARGSHLEDWRQRGVEGIALNLLHGAAVLVRRNQLARQGVRLNVAVRPLETARLERFL